MNELTTLVPSKVKGVDKMLTPEDIALIIGRRVRWVKENLLRPGLIPHLRFGNGSCRVLRSDWEAFIAGGATGFRFAASGKSRKLNGGRS